jgi:hypothetical protein
VTEIVFDVPQAGKVTLAVYDLLGREVRVLVDGPLTAGKHRVGFDAASLPSGLYVYRIQAERYSQTRKMVVLR